MTKKELIENIRDYSPKEIAAAIQQGVVTFYELKRDTHGYFSPLAQQQVKKLLESREDIDKPEVPEPKAEESVIDEDSYTTMPDYVPAYDPSFKSQPQASMPETNSAGPDTYLAPPPNLRKFNLGAFIFGWLWGVCNGVTWSLVALPCAILASVFRKYSADAFLEYGLPVILNLAVIAISFTLGINGNKMAWNSKKFASAEVFEATQEKWKKAAFIVCGIALGLSILCIILIFALQ